MVFCSFDGGIGCWDPSSVLLNIRVDWIDLKNEKTPYNYNRLYTRLDKSLSKAELSYFLQFRLNRFYCNIYTIIDALRDIL